MGTPFSVPQQLLQWDSLDCGPSTMAYAESWMRAPPAYNDLLCENPGVVYPHLKLARGVFS